MSDKKIQVFCDKIKEKLGATACRSFSGRLESLVALIDGLELGPKDCIFVSALAPSEVVKAILACGANPVLCDVTPDSLTVDHRALEAAVRHIISGGQVYPRAAIIENFCGMPFASRAIKNVCDRMGLILIEDCGEDFGGTSDGVMCGAVGDYSLISLGRSSVFGTGGTGSLVVVNDGTDFTDKIAGCDGSSYQSADDFYTDALLEAADGMDRVLASGREAAAVLEDILAESDFWVQRGSGRQKSSFGRLAVIGQSEQHAMAAAESFASAGLSEFVRPVHVHTRSCFKHGCGGFKNINNAAAVAPRAFSVDLFGAIHAGRLAPLTEHIRYVADTFHE